jgi:hypothetical protein
MSGAPWLIVGLTVLVGLSVATGTEHEPVDQFGDLSKLIVHGADAFSPHRLRDALRSDFVTIAAAHPRAPLESLPQVVQERLLAGYQQAGHVDARVEVRINRAQHCLEAVIDEGPVYLCGDVRIEGAVSIDAAQLTERLTLPYVPEKAVELEFTSPLVERTVERDRRTGTASFRGDRRTGTARRTGRTGTASFRRVVERGQPALDRTGTASF